jgi:hypothetical protein
MKSMRSQELAHRRWPRQCGQKDATAANRTMGCGKVIAKLAVRGIPDSTGRSFPEIVTKNAGLKLGPLILRMSDTF